MNNLNFWEILLVCLIAFSCIALLFGTIPNFDFNSLKTQFDSLSFDSRVMAGSIYYFHILDETYSNFDWFLPQGLFFSWDGVEEKGIVYLNTSYGSSSGEITTDTKILWETYNSSLFSTVLGMFKVQSFDTGSLVYHGGYAEFPDFSGGVDDWIMDLFRWIGAGYTYVTGIWDFHVFLVQGIINVFTVLLSFPLDLADLFFYFVFGIT